jgi:branched-chain amino acid transport system ATP-binding protein
MLFEIKDLRVYYEGAEVIKDISLCVEDGEIVTLIGNNGAGKTTILRTISGLKAASTGEIWFEGRRIDRMLTHDIVRLGLIHVPQGRELFPYMSVLENLNIGAYLRKDKDEIKRGLERVYEHFPVLKERMHQKAGTLSGGEQQMLAIACGLMAEPKLLLLDEPSSGLSPILVNEIGQIVYDINQGGTTILLVEQNAKLALDLADRCYVLETGNIVLSGKAKELMDSQEVKKAYLGE